WHRDGPNPSPKEVNGALPWLYTKIGYFFTDLTIPAAGALRVVPGSNSYGGNVPTFGGEPYGAPEFNVKAGSAVIFENRLLHAVGPNYSKIARKNIYIGYCFRYIRPIDYITQPAELLAKATPIQRQLLGEVPNGLSFYLPKEEEVPLVSWYRERTGGEKKTVKGNI
ncbi:MAG: phytanoyl-CoA dioxygenase family protein, partial [Spirochaetia bacterium]|nr:phytanoyl-CoA dioxygenase family protein [Spirochaetia bacterium]